ncbi:hypothetical protein VAWG007_38330 [Aeromonas enteropelogenes]|nr:hypothetical protein VAWG007_38330 [Aeromonas enteropelogenes]
MQVVDAAEQQDGNEKQQQAKPHSGNQRPGAPGLGWGHDAILFVSGDSSIYDGAAHV